MKNRAMRTLALALAMLLACGLALADVRTTATVNLRSGPGLSYEIVTSYSEGKTLDYLDESSVDDRGVTWYKVSAGGKTGWISSKFSVLEGEQAQPAATPEPTAEPTAEPAEPEGDDQPGLPALSAGGLFANSLNPVDGDATPADEPDDTEPDADEPTPLPATFDGAAVELSNFYRADLVTAANDIGLISYRQVESEAPYQYYNDALILAGNQNVENIVVYGAGYEVYGVYVGMSANVAMACLNAAGLDYVQSANGISYEHKAANDAVFADVDGHDSIINLWVNDEDVITEIDWSTYTG